ncbi:hypothetical protein ACIP5L_12730 [Streptomyces bacillaris]|uniref:hypothetical protein n=1 Tax=Streptomyces bacillaris TaxID=68179 RepID=UPI0038129CAF
MHELAELAAYKGRDGRQRLMGERGLLGELTRELMQAAVDVEMDLHLGEESCRIGGRGSHSGAPATGTGRGR